MNTEILNAKQAFEAMSSGQAVLCRAVGELLDFGELSQFPATVFFGADYEFCLAPRFMTIGQLDLEVPECLQGFDDLINSAVYYAPNLLDVNRPIEILSTADNAAYLKRLITSKLLHKTADDAIAHARAFITLNGGSLDPVEIEAPAVEVKEVETVVEPEVTTELAPEPVAEKPKKPTSTEVKKRFIKALNEATREREVFAIETQITVDSYLNKRDLNSLKSMIEQLYAKFKQIETEEINTLVTQFKEQIAATQTTQELIKIRATFASNGTLNDEQHEDLTTCFNTKLAELDSPKTNIQANVEADTKYQELLSNLLNRAANAQTPVEATVLTNYTKSWTEEQRKPLLDAIHKRLAELNPPKKSESSLMVRINNAQSLEELEVLEDEIKQSDQQIQARLYSYANQRRADLVSYEETQNWDDQQ